MNTRSVFAFYLSPMPAAMVFAPVIAGDTLSQDPVGMFFILLLILWGMQMALAVPMRWIRAWRGRAPSPIGDTLIGLFAAAAPAMGFTTWVLLAFRWRWLPVIPILGAAIFVVMGAMTGLTYWFLCHRRSPVPPLRHDLGELGGRFD
jgi:hypothetical protein